MLVVRSQGLLRLVTQADQATLAARLLSLWLLDGVPLHPRRAELLAAVRDHGLGWQGADAAPMLGSDGRPCSLFELPAMALARIWQETLDRVDGRGWAAVLIRAYLRERAAAEPGPHSTDLLTQIDETQARELEALSASSGRGLDRLGADLAEDLDLIRTVDTLSLLASGARLRTTGTRVRAEATARGLALAPFPLAGPTTLRVATRSIDDRTYTDLEDLVGALGQARWQRLEVHVEPLASC
jgi:hypothetical protein